ncbi:PP2C family protein-serine/threonine phosphatase [Actinomadura chibensis]|nr:GAF domain-containing SpoIIE family protein phosphatase [Actinomadura chibensis]
MEQTTEPADAVADRLADIRAITDRAFAHMDIDEFLDVLLERVRQALGADTAVVLLLDRQKRFLVAAAAKGIEEEVVQAAHVPLGYGFAGRVAVERRPIVISDVRKANVFNPLLMQRGLHSLLGVPLISEGTLVGVMHVGTVTPRRFGAEDVELLQHAATPAAMAVQLMLGRAERAGAMELQRSLVPAALPEIPGMELSARYRPGKETVGGDWYDVFTLPSGEIGVVMGDVAGHGLPSAVVMGRMRSALRAYALETTDPAEVLLKLNRKMLHFEPDATATVLYAVFDPGIERVRISSAGHCPPLLAEPGAPARCLAAETDVLIGLEEINPRRTTTIDLPPGALLCFYTDGLVERRGESLDEGIARLRKAVYAGPPEQVGAAVMAALIGRDLAEDDVAVLLLRRSETAETG